MRELIVISFPGSKERGAEVLQEVAKLRRPEVRESLIGLADAAVIEKDEKGKIRVRQTLESAVKGGQVISSGFWGALVGFFFGGPLLGGVIGMTIGGLLGRKIDIGVDNTFIQNVGEVLQNDSSAVFLLVKDTPMSVVAEALKGFGGVIHSATMSDEALDAFERAGTDTDVRRALAD